MAGNLEFITSASGTSVAEVNVTDCFSADYDVYKIVINNFQTSSADNLAIRMINSSGTVVTDSNYDKATLVLRAYNIFQDDRFTNINYFFQMGDNNANTNGIGETIYIFNPFSSSYTFLTQQEGSVVGPGFKGYKGIGVLKQTTSMTGISFYTNGTSTMDFNASIYGLASN
jgi:hypothetical protein